jgi:hypothetical protein
LVPLPEVAVDPDGEFSLDWIKDATHMLSASVSVTGELNYGAVYGASYQHGREAPNEDSLAELVRLIRRVYRDA